MALIFCQKCNDQYSDKLQECPSCGGLGKLLDVTNSTDSETASAHATNDTTTELIELSNLRHSGDLSDEEFAAAKRKILGVKDGEKKSPRKPAFSLAHHRKQIQIVGGLLSFVLIAIFIFSILPKKESSEEKATTPVLENPVESLKKQADNGSPDAAFELGQMYFYGQDVEKDIDSAYSWFSRSAMMGDASAQYIMGRKLWEESQNSAAISWFRKSAASGHSDAQIKLAHTYYNGNRVLKDPKRAADYYTKAANQGRAIAQLQIGYMYDRGEGVEKDQYKAANWYRKAADQGNTQAQFNLALCYSNGDGVIQSDKNSIDWYIKAARQGHSGALNNLGVKFRYNYKDYPKAMAYYSLSAQLGGAKGKENRDQLLNQFGQLAFNGWAESKEIENKLIGVIRFNLAIRPKPKAEDELIPRPFWTLKLKGSGTGFFVTQDGYLVTNYHVIENAKRIEIRINNGNRIRANVIKEDKINDLAILSVEGKNFSTLPIASSETVDLGEDVFTVGFPQTSVQGLFPKLTKGSISSLAGLRDDRNRFQISVPVQPGNSGGALVDNHGNVVGVIVSRLERDNSQNVNYAIKSNILKKLLNSIPEIQEPLPKPFKRQVQKKFSGNVGKAAQAASVMVLIY